MEWKNLIKNYHSKKNVKRNTNKKEKCNACMIYNIWYDVIRKKYKIIKYISFNGMFITYECAKLIIFQKINWDSVPIYTREENNIDTINNNISQEFFFIKD